MQQYRAMLEELLRTTQVVRKNQIANETRAVINAHWADSHDGIYPTDEEVERILADMYPWVWGPKSIMTALIKVLDMYDRGSAPTGQDVYNILTIAHRLDQTGIIRKSYETFTNEKRTLPKPNIRMCVEGLR